MPAKRGFCPMCGKRLPRNAHAAWKRRDPKGWNEARNAGDMWCETCDAADNAAEAASLGAAESGLAAERLNDLRSWMDYGE